MGRGKIGVIFISHTASKASKASGFWWVGVGVGFKVRIGIEIGIFLKTKDLLITHVPLIFILNNII